MNKYSGVYKFNGYCFRYDFDDCIVEMLDKLSAKERKEEDAYFKEHGHHLREYDEKGYSVVDGVGLSRENWKRKEVRDEYLGEWLDEMSEEMEFEIACEMRYARSHAV